MSRVSRALFAVGLAAAGAMVGATALAGAPAVMAAPLPEPTERTVTDGHTTFTVVTNPGGGDVLSYVPGSGVSIMRVKTPDAVLAFKDMNGNKKLDVWEDWRRDVN